MALISASIPNLINGVSQQPPSLRLKTQAELQENGLSSVVSGLVKRPASEFIASLGPLNSSHPFIHTMKRDDKEYYILIITENSIRVFDDKGVERTVDGDASYLVGLTNPAEELAATTVADYTFILNKKTIVKKDTKLSSTRNPEAMVYVKQGDYRTKYEVKITKNGTVYTRSLETMSSTQDTNTLVSNAERSIQTDRIATNLRYDVTTDSTYYGLTSAGSIPNIAFYEYGNVLHIVSTDGVDFDIEVEDSRGNQHLFGFKGACADFDKLPPTGPEGFKIKVVGDNDKGQDDYYVALTKDPDTGGLVWKETVGNNIEVALDASTMPHQLVSNADGSFTFRQSTYRERKVGDDNTNPFPSFVGLPLADIFFHRNRLGLLADENVIFSEAGAFEEFNFFLKTTLTLLGTDVIDLAVSNNRVSILKHAVPFNQSLLLFSDLTQFRLDADELLGPATARVNISTQFEASLGAKPVGAGKYVFFATKRGKWGGVREYFVNEDTETNDAADITAHCPEYLAGRILKLEASSNEDTLLALCEDDPNAIYVYRYYWNGTEKLQSSWSRWTFKGKVLNVSFIESDINLLMEYDGHASLERINLSTDTAYEYTDNSHSVHLDRRVMLELGRATIPYTHQASDIIYVAMNGGVVSKAEADNIINAGGRVYAGLPYMFRYELSELVMKNQQDPITIGKLQLRNMSVVYSETGYFETVVTPLGRDPKVSTFNGRVLGSSTTRLNNVSISTGTYRFYVLGSSKNIKIELRSDSHLPCAFQSAEWEGFFVLRSRRL